VANGSKKVLLGDAAVLEDESACGRATDAKLPGKPIARECALTRYTDGGVLRLVLVPEFHLVFLLAKRKTLGGLGYDERADALPDEPASKGAVRKCCAV
jgi:hypothetical protein